ncbi:PQQ-binding-like beta-propeller repeat protein [Streptomyces sp. NPDC056817]|uniref:beta-alanine-activating enzyme beta-propeller domain-containing protein n=1 Tax=Streptomyces sp. NPDC056817 TaxID=3345950 RepID=UPI003692EE43
MAQARADDGQRDEGRKSILEEKVPAEENAKRADHLQRVAKAADMTTEDVESLGMTDDELAIFASAFGDTDEPKDTAPQISDDDELIEEGGEPHLFHETVEGMTDELAGLRRERGGRLSSLDVGARGSQARTNHRRVAEWDGVTLRSTLHPEAAAVRDRLADAARDGDWQTVFRILDESPSWANSAGLERHRGYAPLHQAAWHGATVETVERLLSYGAWRTLRTSSGDRPIDIAARRGHRHLTRVLSPEVKHPLSRDVLARLQRSFHNLIREIADPEDGRGPDLPTRERLRLPELEVLTELGRPACWFPVPGMYGGFLFELQGAELIVDSWVRVVEGSERTHHITVDGVRLEGAWAATGTERWTYATGGNVFSSPAVVGGTVYVGSDDGKVYALDAATGAKKWAHATGGAVFSSPAVVDGTVYCGSTDHTLYALHAATGSKRWTYTTGGTIGSSPAVVGGTVYVGSDDGKVYALDAATGTERWTYTTGGAVWSSPAVIGDTVYVGSDDHTLYALDAAAGVERWTHTTRSRIFSSPAVVDGTVYAGSDDGKVYALDAATGTERWTYTTGGPVRSSPTVVDGTVYIGSNDHTLYALDAATGTERWTCTTAAAVDSSPAVVDGTVYVGSNDHGLYMLNATTGTERWIYPTGGAVRSSPAIVDGTVYVGSNHGIGKNDPTLFAVDTATGAGLAS